MHDDSDNHPSDAPRCGPQALQPCVVYYGSGTLREPGCNYLGVAPGAVDSFDELVASFTDAGCERLPRPVPGTSGHACLHVLTHAWRRTGRAPRLGQSIPGLGTRREGNFASSGFPLI